MVFQYTLALLSLLSATALAGPLGQIAQGAKGISLALDPQEPVRNTTAVLSRNCAYFGWFPDDGNRVYGSTGVQHTLQEINTAVGIPSFAVGGYAHQDNDLYDPLDASTHFNGSEWAQFLPEAVATNAVFVASLNPVHGYGGFQPNDTQNLDALITVLQAFVEQGVTVWLRYAFEFNWYTLKGSDDLDPNHKRTYYDPSVANFLSSWKLVYTKVKAALPSVQLMWCANTAPNDQIRPFWPGPEYVDITAIDYYTYLNAPQGDYYNILGFTQDFHDEFALPHNKSFWLGETGTRSNRTQDNLQWVKTCTSQDTCNAMPNYKGLMWFNFLSDQAWNTDFPLLIHMPAADQKWFESQLGSELRLSRRNCTVCRSHGQLVIPGTEAILPNIAAKTLQPLQTLIGHVDILAHKDTEVIGSDIFDVHVGIIFRVSDRRTISAENAPKNSIGPHSLLVVVAAEAEHLIVPL